MLTMRLLMYEWLFFSKICGKYMKHKYSTARQAWYAHQGNFDLFHSVTPKLTPVTPKLTTVIPIWIGILPLPRQVSIKFQVDSSKTFWVMLQTLHLTFVTSVTLKIEVKPPRETGFLIGLWKSYILSNNLTALIPFELFSDT